MLQNIVNTASETHKIRFLFSSPGDSRGYVIMYESCFFLSFVANIQVFFIGENYQVTREQCHFVLRGNRLLLLNKSSSFSAVFYPSNYIFVL